MVFSSLTFLFLFLPVLYLLTFLSPNRKWRNGILIVFSLLFYAWGEPVWILAMLFSTGVNYVCALLIDRTDRPGLRKLCLIFGVIASICFLFYFKYAAFLVNTVTGLAGLPYTMKDPGLPIGISFYTFQILTYTVDVYRRNAGVQKNPLRLLLYISCFPQLIAGPIVQYRDIEEQLEEREISPEDFAEGMSRFVKGLGKKVLLANICGAALEELPLGGAGAAMSLGGAWLAAFYYTMQIYFDFSAYSDMAIGLGRTLGFRYKENFNFPYVSGSITEFWRRWHISLGSFCRDYVYIPLGGNRRGTGRTILNMLIVWSLTGLWHGASWNFVIWGAYYGLLLITERFVLARFLDHVPHFFRAVLTFLIVTIGWVIFYYTDFPALSEHLRALFGIGVPILDPSTVSVVRKYTVYPLLALFLSFPLVPWLGEKLPRRLRSVLRPILVLAIFTCSVMFLVGDSYNPFIYFRF